MEIEMNDVTDQRSWSNSHGVGEEDAVATPVGLPAAGSAPSGSDWVRTVGLRQWSEPHDPNHCNHTSYL